MLNLLRVRNFAIIDELEVEFGPGLNVVTGETGAGKSVIVAALQLVLGARGRPEVVRTGAERAEVEALFDLRGDPDVGARLAEAGLEAEDELVVRRVVEPGGRTRAYANGRLVPAGQLERLAAGLVDISSQHEHHTLTNQATHLGYLDDFAGLGPARAHVAAAVAELAAVDRAVNELCRASREAGEREDLLRFQVSEIERVAPRPDEEGALAAEIARLRHADDLQALLGRAEGLLYADDGAVTGTLARVVTDLTHAVRIDPSLERLLAPVEAARSELEDAARAIGKAARGVRSDPERLTAAEERLHALRRLLRKYGTAEAAIAFREAAVAELASLEGLEDRAAELDARRARAVEAASRSARALSERRKGEARRLGAAITAELASLGMGEAKVEVSVVPLEGGPVDGARLTTTGIDRVEFLIGTNPGEEPRPLRKVASGGELSRALLALKRVLSGLGPVGLYVFDEVDSGVGGAVAAVIGRKLAEVARHHQVLCITHLPQVAAFAQSQFHVRKEVAGGRTRSLVRRLEAEERVEELGRMLGGARPGAAAREAALELLEQAREP